MVTVIFSTGSPAASPRSQAGAFLCYSDTVRTTARAPQAGGPPRAAGAPAGPAAAAKGGGA